MNAARPIIERLRAGGCVFAEDEAEVLMSSASTPAEVDDMVARRVDGHPLEHVVGWATFHGVRIFVDPRVFVPRRRSELLVDEAVRALSPGAIVVDLCCGSGAVAAVLATIIDGIELHATDIEPAALRCARRNLEPHRGTVHEGDLYGALPRALRGQVDVIVANAPYVPTGAIATMPHEAREHEPAISLDGGADGLDVQRRVVAEARAWLTSGGHLLIETSQIQADATRELFDRHGFVASLARSDELDATVVIGTMDADRVAQPMHRATERSAI